MSLTRKVAYNTLVQIAGKVITTFISLVLIASLTRYLGVSGFGQYTTIFAYTQFFAVVADFGFFWYLVREISKPGAEEEKTFNNVLTFRAAVALVIFLISIIVATFIPQYHEIRTGIAIIALGSFWMSLNGTYVGIFQKNLRMDKAALTDVLGRAVIMVLVLWLINLRVPLNTLLWAYSIGNFVNFFASAVLGRAHIRFRLAFDLTYWKRAFWQCLPISIVTILGIIYFKIDTVMLSLMKGTNDVGIYGPPYKMLEIILLLPAIFMGNVFPIFSRYIHENKEKLKAAFQKSFEFLFLLALPIVVGTIFLAPGIIRIVAGEEFLNTATIGPVFGIPATSALALQILIIAVGVSFLSHLFSYTVIAAGKQTKLIWPNLLLVILNIGLNLIFIPRLSYIGAAIVTVLTEITVVTLYWITMRRYVELRVNLGSLPKIVFSGIIMGLVLWLLHGLNIWILILISASAYFLSLWLFKGISREMIWELLGREKKALSE